MGVSQGSFVWCLCPLPEGGQSWHSGSRAWHTGVWRVAVWVADPWGNAPHHPILTREDSSLQKPRGQQEQDPGFQSGRVEKSTGPSPSPGPPAPPLRRAGTVSLILLRQGKGVALMPPFWFTNEETEAQRSLVAYRRSRSEPELEQGFEPWQNHSSLCHEPSLRCRREPGEQGAGVQTQLFPRFLATGCYPCGASPPARSKHRHKTDSYRGNENPL